MQIFVSQVITTPKIGHNIAIINQDHQFLKTSPIFIIVENLEKQHSRSIKQTKNIIIDKEITQPNPPDINQP